MKTVTLIIVFTVLLSCSKNSNNIKSQEEVLLAETRQPLNGLIYVAKEKGYFDEVGLNIKFITYTSGKSCLEALIKDDVVMATVADTPIVNAIISGEEIYNVATIQNTGRNVVILGLKDQGIKIPADLEGKTLGVTKGSGGEFFVDIFLLYHGINKSSLNIVDILPENMMDSITTRKVDAVCTWNPHVINIEKAYKNDIVTFYGEELYRITFNLAVKNKFINNSEDKIIRILKALIKAEDFLFNNENQAKEIISRSIKMDIELLNELWDIYHFQVSLDNYLLTEMNELGRWVIETKSMVDKELPDFRNYIYTESLRSVKPEAVGIK